MEFTVGMEVKAPLGLGTIKDVKNDGELILVEQTNGITTYLAEYPKDDLLPSVGHSDLYFAKVFALFGIRRFCNSAPLPNSE